MTSLSQLTRSSFVKWQWDQLVRIVKDCTMKRRKSCNLLDFFAPTPKRLNLNNEVAADIVIPAVPDTNEIEIGSIASNNSLPDSASASVTSVPIPTEKNHCLDVGVHIGRTIDDEVKLQLLTTSWIPPPNFNWPYSIRRTRGREEKRYLRPEHLEKYSCIVFSPTMNGLLCRSCVLFASQTAGKGSQDLGCLVTKPVQRYDKLFGQDGYISTHLSREYHEFAETKADQFLKIMRKPEASVLNQMDGARRHQVEDNRARLVPIVKTILFLGHQGLPLRGHRDDGRLNPEVASTACNDSVVGVNEGNFRALLLYRVDSGDAALKKHLLNSASNATYISKTTQNELIECCGELSSENIVNRIRGAKFFTVLADETTDNGSLEQMSLCLRYVYDNNIHEDFLKFVHVTDLTGQGLANTILTQLREAGLEIKYLVGQGYDGASSMSGEFSGVQAEVRKSCPAAVYVHCASHSLNLVLSSASDVQAIRNCSGVISEVANMINKSAKRVDCLKTHIAITAPAEKKQTLTHLCQTRWVERHDAVIHFKALYLAVVECFRDMQTWRDTKTSSKSRTFLTSITSSEFIVALCVLERVLCVSLTASIQLQNPAIDLLKCMEIIDDVKGTFQDWRDTPDHVFSLIFNEAQALFSLIGETITAPRTTGRQMHRQNAPSNGPEEYYRRNVFIPFLDNLLLQLSTRFEGHSRTVYTLSALVPKFVNNYKFACLDSAIELYKDFLKPKAVIEGEFQLWSKKWEKREVTCRPATATEALQECNSQFYPNIHTLLTIYATIPVTTATAERTFSTLNRLKSYLRSTMSNDRLTGLALLNIHRNIPVEVNKVIDKFARKGSRRRLDFHL